CLVSSSSAQNQGSQHASTADEPRPERRVLRSRQRSSSKRALSSVVALDHPTLMTLMDRFGTDDECRAVLEELRWPTGPRCPRCDGGSQPHPTQWNRRG